MAYQLRKTDALRERVLREHGFTDDASRLERVREFRDAARDDGWASEPTYENEAEDSHATMSRDGFTLHAMCREGRGAWKYCAQISIWGPDGVAVETPETYSMDAVIAGLRRCEFCNAKDVETHRVAFANRSCGDCLEEQRRIHETPGWCS